MMREVIRPTKACQEMVEEHFRPHFNLLLDIFNDLLPEDVPAFKRRQMGFSVIGQCLYYRVAGGVVSMLVDEKEFEQHYSVEQLAEHISDFTLAALAGNNRGILR